MEPYKNVRLWAKTLKKLRLLAAMTDKTIMALVDVLADQELERQKQEELHGKRGLLPGRGPEGSAGGSADVD